MSDEIKVTEKSRSGFKKALIGILIAVLVLIIGGAVCLISIPIIVENKVKERLESMVTTESSLSTKVLLSTLEASSELVTSKMTLVGYAEYDDEGVPVINKGDFVMIYKSTVKAGIDVKDVRFAVDDAERKLYIYVPNAEILDVKVLPDSIKYFDESFSLFNTDKKEDALDAQAKAEKDAEKEAIDTGILEMADNQSETLVRGILEGVAQGYEMKFMRSVEDLNKKQAEIDAAQAETTGTEASE